MEDDLKKMEKMEDDLKKMEDDLNLIPLKVRGKPFLGLDQLSKIFQICIQSKMNLNWIKKIIIKLTNLKVLSVEVFLKRFERSS